MGRKHNKRTLIATEHGSDRYIQRLVGCAKREWRELMDADFAAARLLDRTERERYLFDTGGRNYAWRKTNATYFLNEQTLTVFVCEAVDHRTFRLITCFKHDSHWTQKAG